MRRVLRLLVILVVPIVLTTMVRGLTFPWYARFEYARPGFPADPFGLPPEERSVWLKATIRYLNLLDDRRRWSVCALLTASPAYNERELGHMEDVKAVLDGLTLLAGIALAVGLASAWILARLDRCAPLVCVGAGGRSRWRCCWDWRPGC